MPPSFDINAAERFANLALACVHREYSNKISHNLDSDLYVAPPRKLTPALLLVHWNLHPDCELPGICPFCARH
jgi:hypothetical protein